MEHETREAIITAIIEKWGSEDSGCYIDGEWFSPAAVIELLKEF